MRILLFLFALLPALASAQNALPNLDPTQPGAMDQVISKNGACVWWHVYLDRFTPQNQIGIELAVYCALPSEFPKIGWRVQTIVNAADPLRSLQTLPNRIAGMSRISCQGIGKCTAADPALAPIVAEMNAARGY